MRDREANLEWMLQSFERLYTWKPGPPNRIHSKIFRRAYASTDCRSLKSSVAASCESEAVFTIRAGAEAMRLFSRELARQLTGTGVTANSWHLGFVATRFGDRAGGLISFSLGIAKCFALTPQQSAETLVYLASSSEVAGVTGQYFHKCKPATPSRETQDARLAERLWAETVSVVR